MSGEPGSSSPDVPARAGGHGPGDRAGSYDAIWEWDLPSGALEWERGLAETFGYDADVAADLEWWCERVHPDDRERVEENLADRLASGRSWETRCRFRRADGEHVEVALRGVIVRGDGEPERLIGTIVDRDRRRQVRRAIDELDERYRTIVEQNLVGISLAREGEFVHVNPRLAEIHGYDREELIGTDPMELVPEGPRDEVLSEVHRMLDGETDEATVSGPVRRKGGGTAYVESYLKRIEYRDEEAFLAVTVDVTDQVEAERARATTERLFRAVFENAIDGIVVANDDGVLVDANPEACEILGVERESILGEPIEDVDDVEFDFEVGSGLFRSSGEGPGLVTLVRPDGGRRIVEFTATTGIVPNRHLSILRDVTDRERREAALEAEREHLDFLNAMLRHHVLNGMNIVLATADHLAADAEGERLDRLETIQGRGRAIVDLVQTIRSLVRTIRTSEARGFEPVDLGGTLERSVEAAATAHDDATVALEGAGADADLYVHADAMLSEAFDALLDNAIVHNDSAEPEVEVRVEADGDSVSVNVADDGPGIPRSVREDLFAEGTGSGVGGSSGGGGFGLNVVRLLVDLYGGSMRIRDREPEGTVVTVTLPRAYPGGE